MSVKTVGLSSALRFFRVGLVLWQWNGENFAAGIGCGIREGSGTWHFKNSNAS
jgi:hypothetical protein